MYYRTFDDFEREANEFEAILKQYKNNKTPYVDKTFPIKMNQETKINADSIDRWERIDKIYKAPLFSKNLINPSFIRQGEIGNCYFITALIRIAKDHRLVKLLFDIKTPNKILGKVHDSINLECGAVVIYFYSFGRKTPVLIDTLMPMKNNRLIFSKPSDDDKSIWFCLVEKAYAKLKGSYSNIVSGLTSKAIYSLFGYYPVNKKYDDFMSKYETKKMTPFDFLMKYQSQNAIMSCAINQIPEEEAEKRGLVTNHEYLIYKVRNHKDHLMICLINPWGHTEWNGDWSKKSPLWTNEMKTELDVSETENGTFWMEAKDFFKYFIEYTVSKPISMKFYSRRLFIQLKPNDVKEESPKFILKMNDKIPENTKCKIHIVVERHNSFHDYENNETIEYGIYLFEVFGNSKSSIDLTNNSENYTYTKKINNTKSTIEITFNRCGKCLSSDDLYVLIFCEYDFILYNNEKPDYLYPLIENPAIVFSNHSNYHSKIAKPLFVKQKNGKDILDFASSYHITKEDEKKVSKIFKKLANIESDYSIYSSSNNIKSDESEDNKKIDKPSVFEIASDDKDETKDNVDLLTHNDIFDLSNTYNEQSDVNEDEQSNNDLSTDSSNYDISFDDDKQTDQNDYSKEKNSSNKTDDSDFNDFDDLELDIDDDKQTDQNEISKTIILSNETDDFDSDDFDDLELNIDDDKQTDQNEISKIIILSNETDDFDSDDFDDLELNIDDDNQEDQSENSKTIISSIKTDKSDMEDNEQNDQIDNSKTNKFLSTDDEEKSNSNHDDNSEINSESNDEIQFDFLDEYSEDEHDETEHEHSSSKDDEENLLTDINPSTNSLNSQDEKIIINIPSTDDDSIKKIKNEDDIIKDSTENYEKHKKKEDQKKKEKVNKNAMYYNMKSVLPFYRTLQHCEASLKEKQENFNKKVCLVKKIKIKIESLKNEIELIKNSDSCEKRFNLEKKQKELDDQNTRLIKEEDELKNLKNKFYDEKQKIIQEETKIKNLCDPKVLECVKNQEEERQKNLNWPKQKINPINIGDKNINKRQQKQRKTIDQAQLNFFVSNISPEKLHVCKRIGKTSPKTARKKCKVINSHSDLIQIPSINNPKLKFGEYKINKKTI